MAWFTTLCCHFSPILEFQIFFESPLSTFKVIKKENIRIMQLWHLIFWHTILRYKGIAIKIRTFFSHEFRLANARFFKFFKITFGLSLILVAKKCLIIAISFIENIENGTITEWLNSLWLKTCLKSTLWLNHLMTSV